MTGLTFAQLAEANRSRCPRWHHADTEPWTSADWSNALAGEVGELAAVLDLFLGALVTQTRLTAATGKIANAVKKLRRHDTGTSPASDGTLEELRSECARELADVVCYADLLAWMLDLDLADAVVEKFNAVSERQGFPERLTNDDTFAGRRDQRTDTGRTLDRAVELLRAAAENLRAAHCVDVAMVDSEANDAMNAINAFLDDLEDG